MRSEASALHKQVCRCAGFLVELIAAGLPSFLSIATSGSDLHLQTHPRTLQHKRMGKSPSQGVRLGAQCMLPGLSETGDPRRAESWRWVIGVAARAVTSNVAARSGCRGDLPPRDGGSCQESS